MIPKKIFAVFAIFLLAGCEVGGVALTKPVVFCEFENEKYQPGETIPVSDGCNSCICSSAGEVGNCTKMNCEEIQQDSATSAGLANPAAVKCSVDGHHYEIREDSEGGQFGVCIDSNSKECDGWAYFRGECLLGDVVQKFAAELEVIAELSGSGAATAEFSAEKFTLTLSARDLPELSESEFYEGWLTRVEPFDQISLGKLVPEGEEGTLALSLETPENLTDHARVSVTLENGEDSKTVLEGVFEKVQ
ncbi:MAG: DUF333 domain-containing protein [Patescibacteria group bacterium]